MFLKIYNLLFVGIGHLSKIATGFVVLKIISVYLGVEGLGALGNFMSLMSAILLLAGGGVSNGIVKYSALFKEEKDVLDSFLLSIFLYGFIACCLIFFIFIFFAGEISFFIFNRELKKIIYFLAISQFAIAFVNFYFSFVNGIGKTRIYVALQIFSFLIGVPVAWIFIKEMKIVGAIYSLVFIYLSPLVGILFCLKNVFPIEVKKIDFSYWRKIYPFSLMALTSFFSVPVIEILIRNLLLSRTNYADVGIWQASMRLSSAYLGFFLIFLSYVFLPKIAILKNKKEILKEIGGTICFVWIVFLIGSMILFFNIDFFVSLLLSPDFLRIKNYIIYQIAGDFFRVSIFVIGYFFVAKSNTKKYIFLEISQYIIYYILSIVLIGLFEDHLQSVMVAYSIAFCISFFLCMYLLKFNSSKDYYG